METIKGKLLTALSIVMLFTNLSAQTNKEQKTLQQQQEEYGKALKEWFDSGDIIIEAITSEENYTWVDTGGINPNTKQNYGYMRTSPYKGF